MTRSLCALAGLLAITPAPVAGAALELKYAGRITQTGGLKNDVVREFTVYAVAGEKDGAKNLTWFVSEKGSGGWAWPERFGSLDLGAKSQTGIRLLHTHDGTPYPVPVPTPVFVNAAKLKRGANWADGPLSFEVTGRSKVAGRDCWVVDVVGRIGRVGRDWVDAERGLRIKSERTVFMGRGDRFSLTAQLVSASALADEKLVAVASTLDGLLKLQKALDRKPGETRGELSDKQLAQASQALTALSKQSQSTPVASLVNDIRKDVAAQLRRDEDVSAVAKRYVGKPAPTFALTTIAGKTLTNATLSGKITVLHFWKYREPLNEPYGQVGYIDFLNSRRRKLGVQFYGVAVDPRLAEVSKKSAALRSVRKIREFMNLSYDVALDDGKVLRAFGDPRRLGAKLPLWVVVTANGKIAVYKAGLYQIKTNEGLKALDDELIRLIREQRRSKD